MPPLYPAALPTTAKLPTDIGDATTAQGGTPRGGTAGFLAALLNGIDEELLAALAEIGTDPSASFATLSQRLNARLTCRKTADQTFSATTTLASVSDMLLPLTASQDHWFKFFGVYTSASTSNGIRLGLALSTGTANLISARVSIWGRAAVTAGTQGAATTNLGDYEAFLSAVGASVASDATAATATNYPFIVEGIVNPSANSNLLLQAANEVSTTSGNVIKKGAWGEVYIN